MGRAPIASRFDPSGGGFDSYSFRYTSFLIIDNPFSSW